MTDDEIISVVQAHKAGKQIEFRNKGTFQDWVGYTDDNRPSWNFQNYDFRVKPEPRKPREWICNVWQDGTLHPMNQHVENVSEWLVSKTVIVREVIEE